LAFLLLYFALRTSYFLGVELRVLVHIGLVAFGSAVGGLARWGVGLAAARWLGTAFPWGTLAINISGSLFLGWFTTLLGDRLLQGVGWLDADALRLMIAVGFTGAYTTFSTFEYETNGLFRDGRELAGIAYLAVSVFLGLAAVRLGVNLARW
jgi:CrcB protein